MDEKLVKQIHISRKVLNSGFAEISLPDLLPCELSPLKGEQPGEFMETVSLRISHSPHYTFPFTVTEITNLFNKISFQNLNELNCLVQEVKEQHDELIISNLYSTHEAGFDYGLNCPLLSDDIRRLSVIN